MQIKATPNAQDWIDAYPEVTIPKTATICFNGLNSLTGKNAPNIDITEINDQIETIKEELAENIKALTHDDCINALGVSFADLIKDVDIRLITEADSNAQLKVSVRNLFKYRALNGSDFYERDVVDVIKVPPFYKSEEGSKNASDKNLLGVYLPDHGCIMLWIDRILQSDVNGLHPEVVFQQVLLHEFIHALFDIQPRRITKSSNGDYNVTVIGSSYNTDNEETYDNTLVLQVYDKHADVNPLISAFISNQPPQYSKAIQVFAKGANEYLKGIKNHLKSKVEKVDTTFRPSMLYDLFDYTIDDDDSQETEYEWATLLSYFVDHLEEILSYRQSSTIELGNAIAAVFILNESIDIDNRKIDKVIVKLKKDNPQNIYLAIGEIFLYDAYNEILYDYLTKQQLTTKSIKVTRDKDTANWLNQLIHIVNINSKYSLTDFYAG